MLTVSKHFVIIEKESIDRHFTVKQPLIIIKVHFKSNESARWTTKSGIHDSSIVLLQLRSYLYIGLGAKGAT